MDDKRYQDAIAPDEGDDIHTKTDEQLADEKGRLREERAAQVAKEEEDWRTK